MKQSLNLTWEYEGRQYSRAVEVGQTVTIGRLSECDIVISHGKISRRHAQITGRVDGDRAIFELKNLSQTNHILVLSADSQTPVNFDESVELPEGCRFLLGEILVAARLSEPQQPQNVKASNKSIKVRCSNCHELVDASLRDCPWCGTTLAFSGTIM